MRRINKKYRKFNNLSWLFAGKRRFFVIGIMALSLFIVLEATGTTNLLHWRDSQSAVKYPTQQTTVGAGAPNSGVKTPVASSGVDKGTAVDNQGQATTPVTTNPGQWAISNSGQLTLKQPVAQATLKSGDDLSGSAKVSRVQYRLKDNQVGVIAQGFLNVINGNFSGTLQFTSHASSGRLDVFSSDPTGVEINEVQVPVNF